MKLPCSLFCALLLIMISSGRSQTFPASVHRVVFLGDSITYSGGYVDEFAATVVTREPAREIEILNLGLPSETVSGLSEPGHAGGQFPRPDLHERLTRVLAKTKPDFVFACYGMNDGIYFPFSEERFAAFKAGMEKLHAQVQATGAQIVHLTPPVFDPAPLKERVSTDGLGAPYAGYDNVLAKYSAWLLEQRSRGWQVIDLHGPMDRALAEQRAKDPAFAFSKDGVHADQAGHAVLAKALCEGLGLPATAVCAEVLKLVQQQQRVLKDAYLNAAGHLRPGMGKGLPVEEAEAKAAELRTKIQAAVAACSK